MPVDAQTKAAYESAYRGYEAERLEIIKELAALNARLKEVQATQSSLRRRIDPDTASNPSSISLRPSSEKYARISTRWAILDLLNQSPEGMSTSEIAEALKAGGIQTEAVNFANNVSAVLSTSMKTAKNEVESLPDGRWKLTPKGEAAIAHIHTTPRFLRACGHAPDRVFGKV